MPSGEPSVPMLAESLPEMKAESLLGELSVYLEASESLGSELLERLRLKSWSTSLPVQDLLPFLARSGTPFDCAGVAVARRSAESIAR